MTELTPDLIEAIDGLADSFIKLGDDYKLAPHFSYELSPKIEEALTRLKDTANTPSLQVDKTYFRMFEILFRAIVTQGKATFIFNKGCMEDLMKESRDKRKTVNGSIFGSFIRNMKKDNLIELVKPGTRGGKAALYTFCNKKWLDVAGLTPEYVSNQKERYMAKWEGRVDDEADIDIETETVKPAPQPSKPVVVPMPPPVAQPAPVKVDYLNEAGRTWIIKEYQDQLNSVFTNDFLHTKKELLSFVTNLVTNYGNIINWPLLIQAVRNSIGSSKNPVLLEIVNEIVQALSYLEAGEADSLFSQNGMILNNFSGGQTSYIYFGGIYIKFMNYQFKDTTNTPEILMGLIRSKKISNSKQLLDLMCNHLNITVKSGILGSLEEKDTIGKYFVFLITLDQVS